MPYRRKKLTFAISSPDEFLLLVCIIKGRLGGPVTNEKLVAFFYLTVHKWIASDVPSYLQFALKMTRPSENTDFDRFRLIVPQP